VKDLSDRCFLLWKKCRFEFFGWRSIHDTSDVA